MIIKEGQFKERLSEIKEAFKLSVADVKVVDSIEFEQVPTVHMHMAYSATLTKTGKGDTEGPLRFVRRRTIVRLLDKKGELIWASRDKEEAS